MHAPTTTHQHPPIGDETRAPRTWLLTGVTGFIGREFLVRALARPQDRVMVIVRPQEGRSADTRVRELLHTLYGTRAERYRKRIDVFRGDLTQPKFGMYAMTWEQLRKATHIVHMAARTCFDGTLEEARAHNVDGVRRMLEVARVAHAHGHLQSFVHVSTAYVAGARTDTVSADDLDPRGAFRNVYEQSKAEAEALVNAARDELPCTIFRPSIVIGDSRTGEVANFNTIYWAIRAYLRGQRHLFANGNSPLDLVPVNYVTDAMMHLIGQPQSVGRTFLLAGGKRTTVRLADFAKCITDCLGTPAVSLLSPKLFWTAKLAAWLGVLPPRMTRLIANANVYLPYFSANPIFDTRATEAALEGTGLEVPPVAEYIDTILGYCLAKGFGERSPMLARSREARARARVATPIAYAERSFETGA